MTTEGGFTVVLWLKLNERKIHLMDELRRLEPWEPFESTEYQEIRDFHRKFDERDEAERFLSSLKDFAAAPEVIVLRLTNYDDVRITPKDIRNTRRSRGVKLS
jgi:hypothetical protein